MLFPRELSLAFRWADAPMAWTYTTVHTEPAHSRILSGVADGRKSTLKVAIAESDHSLRNVLMWCLNQEEGCVCVRGFGSGAEVLQEIRRQPTHLLLISENLSDQPGAECLKQLTSVAPKVAGLLYSVYEDAEELFKSSPGGAASYLFRRTPPTKILEALADARKHRDFSHNRLAQSVRQYFAAMLTTLPFGRSSVELDSLTRREHEILALLSKGHPDKEIADLLRISTWTVHGHLKKIFEKLKAHNRTDAVVKYLNK
jgi:DNA-binding NarL/FixJ family response regulator